jgi:hypothetical protein
MTSPQNKLSAARSQSTQQYERISEPSHFVLVKGSAESLQRESHAESREREEPMWAWSRPAWEVAWQERWVRWQVQWRGSGHLLVSLASAIQHLLNEPLVRRVSPQHRPEARHEFENVELRAGGWGRVL